MLFRRGKNTRAVIISINYCDIHITFDGRAERQNKNNDILQPNKSNVKEIKPVSQCYFNFEIDNWSACPQSMHMP